MSNKNLLSYCLLAATLLLVIISMHKTNCKVKKLGKRIEILENKGENNAKRE